MSTATIQIVQTWTAGKDSRLRAEPPTRCKTAAEANRRAERSAEKFASTSAISQVVDVDPGEVDRTP